MYLTRKCISQGVAGSFVAISLLAVGVEPVSGACEVAAADYSGFEQKLIDMPPDSWLEIPDTHMIDVCAPMNFGVRGAMGCAGIIAAWGSAAYSGAERTLYVWGGGHNDYWGNEVYGFRLKEGRWQRLNDPSPGSLVASAGSDPLPDGKPNSRHTYDGLEYLDHAARLFAQGGSISPNGRGSAVTWLFDPATGVWQNRGREDRPGGYGMASAYDLQSRSVFVRTGNVLWRYDVDSNEWRSLISFRSRPLWPRYEVGRSKTGDIDSRRRLFWSVGSNDFLVWDIARGRLVTEDWVSQGGGTYTNRNRIKRSPEQLLESGGGDVFDAPAPGFTYDSKADQFVAWIGGGPKILDLATRTWKTGSAVGAPLSQVRRGTFGRWRYIPEYNVFILVNGVRSNVFFYKNTAGGPAAPGNAAC